MSRKKTGCCKVHVSQFVGGKFETPIALKDVEAIKYTRNYAEGSNYADNKQNIYKKKLTSIDVDTDFSEIKAKVKALVQGKKYANGSIMSTASDISVPVALLFEENYDDGTAERVVFYNTKLYEKDGEDSTETDSIDFTSQGFAGKAISLDDEAKGNPIEYRIDSGDESYDVNKFDKFFDEVQFFEEPIEVEYADYATGDITDISLPGVEFDKDNKKFTNIYASATTFTFKDGGTLKTATKSGDNWTIS